MPIATKKKPKVRQAKTGTGSQAVLPKTKRKPATAQTPSHKVSRVSKAVNSDAVDQKIKTTAVEVRKKLLAEMGYTPFDSDQALKQV